LEYIGSFLIFLGVIAFVISAIGLIRMPDTYTRMHIGTKSTTMGTFLIVIGVIFLEPTWILKLSLIAFFILLTNPLSSSVLARAIHRDGSTLKSDAMKEDQL